MKAFLFSLFCLLVFPLAAFSAIEDFFDRQETDVSFSSTEGILSSIIANKVSAISGDYVDNETDCLLAGPEPLPLQRFYSSQPNLGFYGLDFPYANEADFLVGPRHMGWQGNYFTRLHFYFDRRDHARHTQLQAIVPHISSSQMLHKSLVLDKVQQKEICALKLVHHKGVTNCASGSLSAKTNPRNTKAFIDYVHGKCHVVTGAGDKRFYGAILKDDQNAIGTMIFHPYKELKANGNQIHFRKQDKVEAYNQDQTTLYGWYDFEWKSAEKLEIKPSHAEPIVYKFMHLKVPHIKERDFTKKYYLKSVKNPARPKQAFEYVPDVKKETWLISQKKLPDNRFVQIDYYGLGDNPGEFTKKRINYLLDPRNNRVKTLKAPVGVDEKPIVTHTFFYDVNFKIDFKKESAQTFEGVTTVYDALKRKTAYLYNARQRLGGMIQYVQGAPYLQTKFCWKEPREIDDRLQLPVSQILVDQSNLKGKIILDANETILKARFFDYDKLGNILIETFSGHLTGKDFSPLKFDNKTQTVQSVENYRKFYSYTDNEFNLLLEEKEENGRAIQYAYYPGKDLVYSKFLCQDKQICAREFYEYDKNNAIVKWIRDDGSGSKIDDLSNVSERKISYHYPRQEIPVGLPEKTDEVYLDLMSGQEKLIRCTYFTYSKDGKPLTQTIYDSNNLYQYTLSWKYDAHGNVIEEVNALGHTILRAYDANNNLIREQGPHPDYITEHLYDYSNRRIQTKEVHDQGKVFYTHYRYDLVGNCIAKIDRYGQETQFQYDDLNRLIQTTYPLVFTDLGWIQPTKRIVYDCLNNPIEEIDENGRSVKRTYNARGKIISQLLPDGQYEQTEYQLDGCLRKKIATNGTITLYERDCFGRILKEITQSPEGKDLSEIQNIYKGMHKIASIDATGLTTNFIYDGTGKMVQVTCGDKIESYEYDSLGRLAKKIEPFEQQSKISCFEYDLLDRIIQERIEDEKGTILRQVSYIYDVMGNRTHISEETGTQTNTQITQFNRDKQVTEITDPTGIKTYFTYDTFQNADGQYVLQTTETDSLGCRLITIYDTLNRKVEVKKIDPWGILLSFQSLLYEAKGNPTQIKDYVIVNGEFIKTLETALAYQETGQVVSVIQAKGLPEQQITQFRYNHCGQKEWTIKPNGTLIQEEYDALGRLIHQKSSDQSIDYRYSYNPRHQPVQIDDTINKTVIQYKYDLQGRLIQEKLANELTLTYTYDVLNRVTLLTLPDRSQVSYRYNAANLTEIGRIKDKKITYTHRYSTIDLTGLPLKMSRPDKRETLFQYDSFKREISQKSPFYEHQESTFDVAGRLVNRKFKDEKGSQENQFTYDFLHHLTSEKGDTNHTYTCDSLHNRLSKNDVSYQSNGLHQLIHQGNCDYQYDQNGNLIVKQEAEEKTSYTYDAFNRLTQVCVKDQIIHYKYDAFHRRIAKILPDQIIRYLYAGQDEIGSVNEKGEIQELRILGLGKGAEIGASVALEFNHQVYIPTHDFSGNIVHLSTLEGKSLETYRYTSFGECQIFAKGKELVASSVANPWRFCSKRLDPETGLLFFGRRFYDPTTARWITTDPSGFVDGPNLYAYLHHHPLHKYDLYGLQEENAQEQTYPLENVDFHDKDTPAQEDCNPNEAPLGFVKSEAKKSKFYYCGFNQVLEMGIGFMHGIMNDIYDAYKSAKTLSTLLDDHFVLHVDNSSRGFVYDIARSFFELVFHVQTKSVKAQQKAWDAFLLNSKGLYLHFCHSEGAIITRNAIETYPEELRQRIIIVAIAPAGYIDDKYAYSVIHYRSTRDIVPLLDVTGAIRCRHSTVVLEPHKDAPLFDHSFDSPTYSKVKEYHINEYKKLCANNGVL